MEILLAYFSATQNTARIAEAIQQGLVEQGARVEVLDITTPQSRESLPDMGDYQGVVFGSPVHYMRAPRIVREWLGALQGKETPCALFFTYGGFHVHPSHRSTVEILSRKEFDVVASAEFPGKHTYNLAGWKAMVGRPNASDFKVARDYTRLIHDRFSGLDPERVGELPSGHLKTQELEKLETSIPKFFPRPPGREEECRMCGLCEESCPAGAMDAEAGKADPDLCQYCMRCVQDCPDEVLTFIDMTEFFYKRMEMDHETPETLRKKQSKIYK